MSERQEKNKRYNASAGGVGIMRIVYRCPFADREACPRVGKFADNSPIFQWSGCSIGPLAMKTDAGLQTICHLAINPAVIQTPKDLAGCHLSDLVILPPGKEEK